jgi:hypothetical protein
MWLSSEGTWAPNRACLVGTWTLNRACLDLSVGSVIAGPLVVGPSVELATVLFDLRVLGFQYTLTSMI